MALFKARNRYAVKTAIRSQTADFLERLDAAGAFYMRYVASMTDQEEPLSQDERRALIRSFTACRNELGPEWQKYSAPYVATTDLGISTLVYGSKAVMLAFLVRTMCFEALLYERNASHERRITQFLALSDRVRDGYLPLVQGLLISSVHKDPLIDAAKNISPLYPALEAADHSLRQLISPPSGDDPMV